MKLVVNNPNNLKVNEMDVVTSKVRAIVVYNLSVFIVNYNNILMFPGGKIRKDEEIYDALKREIKEELGINVIDSDIIPFIEFDDYLYKYHSRKGSIQNKLVKNNYFIINTDTDYEHSILQLSDKEKNSTFEVLKIDYIEMEDFISNFSSSNEAFPFYQRELLSVLKELKNDFYIDKQKRKLCKKD